MHGWQAVAVLISCLLAVITCGFHPGCVAVLPQIVTLVTFIAGGIVGVLQGGKAPPPKAQPRRDASDVTNH